MGLKDSIKTAVKKKAVEVKDSDSIRTAIRKMDEDQTSALIVVKDQDLIGIITDMDILYSVTSGDDLDKTQVISIMTACELITSKGAKSPCVQLDEDESVKNALDIMYQAGVHYLLVSGADDKLIGLISIRDLLKLAIS